MPEWLIFVLSLVGAAVTAFFTARYAVAGSRQQALDTERLKLRYALVERHLEEFYRIAQGLQAVASEVASTDVVARRFLSDYPRVMMSLCSAVGRLVLPEHEDLLRPIDAHAHRCYNDLAEALRGPNLNCGEWSPDTVARIGSRGFALYMALSRLMTAVDIAADARLTKEPRAEIEQHSRMLQNILDDINAATAERRAAVGNHEHNPPGDT
ncbi:MAG: hypothetical protein JSV79_12275 [Armatimonadota bacterium]|nr:MAG: hypothetical protein JSV79_12275 [Armatimonadota bacterium]